MLYDTNFYLSRKFDKFNYYANTEDSVIIDTVRNAQELSSQESETPNDIG